MTATTSATGSASVCGDEEAAHRQAGDASLPRRFGRYIGGLRRNPPGRMMHYPDLWSQPWWDPRQFALCRDLELRSDEIREEFSRLTSRHFQEEREGIPRVGTWNVSFLYEIGGFKNDRNAAACPVTTSIIEAHRTMRGYGGTCYFSCLDPMTTVAAHRGSTNLRLRCHLGIEIPDRCGVRAGGEARSWQAGRCIVFDDSFEHEAWNHSGQRRVVLIVDFWHPGLSDDEVALLTGFRRHAVDAGLALARFREQTLQTS
jgi:aspartate beta-hydroxylase